MAKNICCNTFMVVFTLTVRSTLLCYTHINYKNIVDNVYEYNKNISLLPRKTVNNFLLLIYISVPRS